MAGRILGWLLISDPPYQSTAELADVLQASKGSLSTMTRLLLQMGFIERVAMPGFRRDYFRLKSGAWIEMIRQTVYELTAMRELAERGLKLTENKDTELQQRLKEARDFYAYLEREYPLLIEQWEKERKEARKKK
jgi:DNA-binding transcriptional regulator GbsR (MarR family)